MPSSPTNLRNTSSRLSFLTVRSPQLVPDSSMAPSATRASSLSLSLMVSVPLVASTSSFVLSYRNLNRSSPALTTILCPEPYFASIWPVVPIATIFPWFIIATLSASSSASSR